MKEYPTIEYSFINSKNPVEAFGRILLQKNILSSIKQIYITYGCGILIQRHHILSLFVTAVGFTEIPHLLRESDDLVHRINIVLHLILFGYAKCRGHEDDFVHQTPVTDAQAMAIYFDNDRVEQKHQHLRNRESVPYSVCSDKT